MTDAALAPEQGPLLREFAARYPFELDDFQLAGCAEVEAGRGVLVAAPTGAGKTVVGEFGVFCALRQGLKCFYTTPIKALSNQKYHDLVKRYGADKVGLLTGDSSVNSEADIVVMTTEVLRNMIYAKSATLHQVGYVVMDEVHYLGDRFRGAVWEEIIIGLDPSVQLISLSATVSNTEEFGEWLDEVRGDVALIVSERRPVPLYQHVLVQRKLHDLFDGIAPTAHALATANQRTTVEVNPDLVRLAKEESRTVRDDSRAPRGRSGRGKKDQRGGVGGRAHDRFREKSRNFTSRLDMVHALHQAQLLPAICFIFSRAGCDQAVGQILQGRINLTTSSERDRIQEILDRYVGGLAASDLRALNYESFAEGMRRGIAAHHAGMLPAFKEAVESAFAQGLVKVVFATETLALGINMPARSVVLEKLVKWNGEAHVEVTPGEYTQLTGRAGRRGIDVEGHAIVLWQPGLDPRAVAGLASKRTYPLRSSFAPTYNMAVNVVGSLGKERARALLEQSFAQFQADRSVVGRAKGLRRSKQGIEQAWEQAACSRGDFRAYATMRDTISQREAHAAKNRRQDRRDEAAETVASLLPGDVVWVPAGKHVGWAVVIDPGRGRRSDDVSALMLTQSRQVKRLSTSDFPTAPVVVTRVRVPKHFDPRDSQSRRSLHAAMQARLGENTTLPERPEKIAPDVAILAEIAEIRAAMKAHPCHECPDREQHARSAEAALRLERDIARLQAAADSRQNTIAKHFDKICVVLESLGYLGAGSDSVTDAGRRLARIYSELDLVAAEALRQGVFDNLSGPQLAAVASALVYESRIDGMRQHRLPDLATEQAMSQLRRVRREVGLLERDAKLERGRELDIGFAEAAFAWASGRELAEVLRISGLTAGDFVRWIRQVIDFCGQLAVAADLLSQDNSLDHELAEILGGCASGAGIAVRRAAREAVDMMRRGVVDLASQEN
ncbi:MAG: DEAD/DEAH box helicase [Propionibacteriaceae bacterium]